MVCNEIFLVCFLGALVLILLNYCVKREKKWSFDLRILVLLGIGLMPFVWYGVLVNHSIIHARITYRILSISVYAILSAVGCGFEYKKAG